jgi:hypothetical protein
MSRSNNSELQNPATKFFEWNGEAGIFRYWDKEMAVEGHEKPGANVNITLPFTFVVLDSLSTIKGFSDADNSGFWSNEVRDIKRDEMIVKTKKGVCAKGIYEKVITDRNCNGAKYCQSVYIAYKPGKDKPLEIANIQFTGAALSSWIEFRKNNKVFEGAIIVKGVKQGQKGKVIYQMPVFQKLDLTPETEKNALELDKVLQVYLKAYLQHNNDIVAETNVTENAAIKTEVDNNRHDLIDDEIVNQHREETEFHQGGPDDDMPF